MASELRVKKYNRTQAEAATEEFIATGCSMRQLLLGLFEKEAHTALGFAEFPAYCTEKIGTEWKAEYIYQVLNWARIERAIIPTGIVKSIPRHEAMQLARLPEEDRKTIYAECVELHTGDNGITVRSPRFITDLTHIVNRRLKEIGPTETQKSITSAPVPAKPADSTTVTEPVSDSLFDGGDGEQDPAENEFGAPADNFDYIPDELRTDEEDESDSDPFSDTMDNPMEPTVFTIEVSQSTFNRLLTMANQFSHDSIVGYLDDLTERWAQSPDGQP